MPTKEIPMEDRVKLLESQMARARSDAKEMALTLDAIDEAKARNALRSFRAELGEAHTLLRTLVAKQTVLTEVGYYVRLKMPERHGDVLKAITKAMDNNDPEWWAARANELRLGDVAEEFLAQGA